MLGRPASHLGPPSSSPQIELPIVWVARLPAGMLAVAMVLLWLLVFLPHIRANELIYDDFEHLTMVSQRSSFEILTEPLHRKLRPLGFLLMKAEHTAWGWDEPAGYVAVNAVLHCLNVALVVAVARLVGLGRSGASLAGLLFLLASWVGEAIFAFSCQFDLLAVGLGLFGVILAERALSAAGTTRVWHGVIALLALVAALLAKESAVFAPALLVALPRPDSGAGRRLRVTLAIASLAIYGVIRVLEMPLGVTHYGNAVELYRSAPLAENALRALFALVGVPTVPLAPWARVLSGGGTLFLVVLLALGVVRWARAAGLLAAVAVSLLPVLWVRGGPAGRLLYAPVALLALLGGAGWERALAMTPPLARLTPALLAAGLVYTVGLRTASLDRQRRDWSDAAALARSAMEQVGAQLDAPALFVENLPMSFLEGGLVLQCRAFRDYYEAAGRHVPPIRCRGVALRRRPDGMREIVAALPAPSPSPRERRVVLDLKRR